jgi:metallopeptidase MepB
MSNRGTPPQPAPDFTHTPESIISATKRLIEQSKKLEDSIAKEITPETATFGNVLQPMANDEADMSLEAHILGFYQYVSSDKALRDASSEAEKLMDVGNSQSSATLLNWLARLLTVAVPYHRSTESSPA